MREKDGGAAFPFSPPLDDTGRSAVGYPFPELGMSLRDWFAGQALAGWMASFTPDCGVKAKYCAVSIHAPAKGATVQAAQGPHRGPVSIHAPAKGAT